MKKLGSIITLLLMPLLVLAAAPNELTFTAAVTSANGQLTPSLSWSAPGATGCTASGHSSWTGTKPISGVSVSLPPITMSGTYQLQLACTWPADTSAKVSWTAPTKNTDGSNLTNLAGYTIKYGTSASALTQTRNVVNPTVTNVTIESLAVGTWYFGIVSRNTQSVESALSNIVSKTITAAVGDSKTVSLTINPVPVATVLTVE